jgi:hypothetical protein
MQLATEFRSMGVKCNQKTESREAGSFIVVKMSVPHNDNLFHSFVDLHGKQMVIALSVDNDPEIAFDGSFEFAGVDIVTQTEKRSGGEFVSFRLTTEFDGAIFGRLERINGREVNVTMEMKQRDMFSKPPDATATQLGE